MVKVNHKSLRNILKAIWFTPGTNERWGLNALIVGDPGTGKSSMLKAEARALGLDFAALFGARTAPEDWGGTPSQPDDGTRYERVLRPHWVRGVDGWRDGGGVLLADELTCTPQRVQAAMLDVVLTGDVAGERLHPRVRMVAAANPSDQAADGQALSMPMANRFGHFEIEPPALDDWFSILRGEFHVDPPIDALALEAEVMTRWHGEYLRALDLVEGFLRKFPSHAQRTPVAGSQESEEAWTSRRTWELATRAMAGARIHGLTVDERDSLLCAYLGNATAIEFAGWLREADLPDECDLLDGKVDWLPSVYRPDRTHTVLALCTRAMLGTTDAALQTARARKLWTLLHVTATDAPDVAYKYALAVQVGAPALTALPEALPAMRLTLDVMRAVGAGGMRRA
jgi:MoxR-like ATPase